MITVYSTPNCAQCKMTQRHLDALNVGYSVVDLSINQEAIERVKSLGYSQAPVVVTDEEHWSGFRPDKLNDYKNSLLVQ